MTEEIFLSSLLLIWPVVQGRAVDYYSYEESVKEEDILLDRSIVSCALYTGSLLESCAILRKDTFHCKVNATRYLLSCLTEIDKSGTKLAKNEIIRQRRSTVLIKAFMKMFPDSKKGILRIKNAGLEKRDAFYDCMDKNKVIALCGVKSLKTFFKLLNHPPLQTTTSKPVVGDNNDEYGQYDYQLFQNTAEAIRSQKEYKSTTHSRNILDKDFSTEKATPQPTTDTTEIKSQTKQTINDTDFVNVLYNTTKDSNFNMIILDTFNKTLDEGNPSTPINKYEPQNSNTAEAITQKTEDENLQMNEGHENNVFNDNINTLNNTHPREQLFEKFNEYKKKLSEPINGDKKNKFEEMTTTEVNDIVKEKNTLAKDISREKLLHPFEMYSTETNVLDNITDVTETKLRFNKEKTKSSGFIPINGTEDIDVSILKFPVFGIRNDFTEDETITKKQSDLQPASASTTEEMIDVEIYDAKDKSTKELDTKISTTDTLSANTSTTVDMIDVDIYDTGDKSTKELDTQKSTTEILSATRTTEEMIDVEIYDAGDKSTKQLDTTKSTTKTLFANTGTMEEKNNDEIYNAKNKFVKEVKTAISTTKMPGTVKIGSTLRSLRIKEDVIDIEIPANSNTSEVSVSLTREKANETRKKTQTIDEFMEMLEVEPDMDNAWKFEGERLKRKLSFGNEPTDVKYIEDPIQRCLYEMVEALTKCFMIQSTKPAHKDWPCIVSAAENFVTEVVW